jgi:hypothetical protein
MNGLPVLNMPASSGSKALYRSALARPTAPAGRDDRLKKTRAMTTTGKNRMDGNPYPTSVTHPEAA